MVGEGIANTGKHYSAFKQRTSKTVDDTVARRSGQQIGVPLL